MKRLSSDEMASLVRKGATAWRAGFGAAWLMMQWHARARASSRNAAKQFVWDGKRTIKTRVIAALRTTGHDALADKVQRTTLEMLAPDEQAAWIAEKGAAVESRIVNGTMVVSSVAELQDAMRAMAEALLKGDAEYEASGVRTPDETIMSMSVPIKYALTLRSNEICAREPREDGHKASIDDFQFDGYSVVQFNGSKGDGAVRPPAHIVSLLDPSLVQRLLRVWFAKAPGVKPDVKSMHLPWYMSQKSDGHATRFVKILTRHGLDKIVTPINRKKDRLTDRDVRDLSAAVLPYVHDVRACATDQSNAVTFARRIQLGHFPHTSTNEQYAQVRIDTTTAVEPRVKRIKMSDHKLAVITERVYESDDDTNSELNDEALHAMMDEFESDEHDSDEREAADVLLNMH